MENPSVRGCHFKFYFEHLYFESMLEINVPFIKKSDKEVLQSLARQALRNNSMDNLQNQLIHYQYGLDVQNSNDLNDSNQTMSIVEMNQETLSNLLRRFGKSTSRIWNDAECQIKEYLLHSENFLAILVENKELNKSYIEIRDFTVTNLTIDDVKPEDELEINSGRNLSPKKIPVEFKLDPKQSKLILLKLVDEDLPFKYSYSVKYKLESAS